MLVAKPLLLPLLLALRLRKLGCIQAKVGDRLPVELTRRLQLLAVLELLHGTRGFVAPASICRPGLETVLIERLLDLLYLASRHALGRDGLGIFGGLLPAVLLALSTLLVLLTLTTLPVLRVVLLHLLRLLTLRWLLIAIVVIIGVGGSERRGRGQHGGRKQGDSEFSHDDYPLMIILVFNARETALLLEHQQARGENPLRLARWVNISTPPFRAALMCYRVGRCVNRKCVCGQLRPHHSDWCDDRSRSGNCSRNRGSNDDSPGQHARLRGPHRIRRHLPRSQFHRVPAEQRLSGCVGSWCISSGQYFL